MNDRKAQEVNLFVDGASRGNPGPASAGVFGYVGTPDQVVCEMGIYLGKTTNNVAEYAGLALALHLFTPQPTDPPRILHIHADSLLMVRQFNGEFKVRNERLKGWFALVKDLARGINCTVSHVRREYNKEADRCANQGIDDKVAIPESFRKMLVERRLLP